jgi:hypothetical protein
VKLRIRPSGRRYRKVRLPTSAARADVVLALISAIFVTAGLAAFTMLCWRVGSELGALSDFPVMGGYLRQREPWLLIAVAAVLLASLIEAFAAAINRKPAMAGVSTAENLRHLAVMSD